MQHSLSTSWKKSCSTDYPTMVEDGSETSCTQIPDVVRKVSGGSIVGSLLRKSNGFKDGMHNTGSGSGLEQKIQELRAEKEAEEMAKCPTSIYNDQDSPLDFSVKRRSSFSGSLTDDSQASSSSPGNVTDYNSMSPGPDPESVNHNDVAATRSTPSPDRFEDSKILGHPSVVAPNISIAQPRHGGMGLFSGLPSEVLSSRSALTTFSQMAAAATVVDPRNKKNSRPFRAYPKEALQMPLGFFGISGLTPAAFQQSVESGLFSSMNNEELLNLYNQKLQHFRDKQLPGQEGKASPPFPMQTSNGNDGRQIHPQQQHNQYHSQHHRSSPSIILPTTATSTSPPLFTPDHLKTGNCPSTSLSVPAASSSINTTIVSSTSCYSQSGSRKRPRSLPDDQKDAAYWERRRKNNDAAKRSRDARRAKEDEIALRAVLLEQENLKLRVEVAALKTETARLRSLLYNN